MQSIDRAVIEFVPARSANCPIAARLETAEDRAQPSELTRSTLIVRSNQDTELQLGDGHDTDRNVSFDRNCRLRHQDARVQNRQHQRDQGSERPEAPTSRRSASQPGSVGLSNTSRIRSQVVQRSALIGTISSDCLPCKLPSHMTISAPPLALTWSAGLQPRARSIQDYAVFAPHTNFRLRL
jgi:hypothetical protein